MYRLIAGRADILTLQRITNNNILFLTTNRYSVSDLSGTIGI